MNRYIKMLCFCLCIVANLSQAESNQFKPATIQPTIEEIRAWAHTEKAKTDQSLLKKFDAALSDITELKTTFNAGVKGYSSISLNTIKEIWQAGKKYPTKQALLLKKIAKNTDAFKNILQKNDELFFTELWVSANKNNLRKKLFTLIPIEEKPSLLHGFWSFPAVPHFESPEEAIAIQTFLIQQVHEKNLQPDNNTLKSMYASARSESLQENILADIIAQKDQSTPDLLGYLWQQAKSPTIQNKLVTFFAKNPGFITPATLSLFGQPDLTEEQKRQLLTAIFSLPSTKQAQFFITNTALWQQAKNDKTIQNKILTVLKKATPLSLPQLATLFAETSYESIQKELLNLVAQYIPNTDQLAAAETTIPQLWQASLSAPIQEQVLQLLTSKESTWKPILQKNLSLFTDAAKSLALKSKLFAMQLTT